MKRSSPRSQSTKNSKRSVKEAGLDPHPKPAKHSRTESRSSSTHSTLDVTTADKPLPPLLQDATDTEPHVKSVGTPTPSLEDAVEEEIKDISTHTYDVEELRSVEDLHPENAAHPPKASDLEHNEGDSPIAAGITQPPTDGETSKVDRDDRDQKLAEAESEGVSKNPDARKGSLLPLELHRLILGYFWDDKHVNCESYRTLRACALTCSRWRAAARPYIFRFLVLRGPKDFKNLATQLCEEPDISGWIKKIRLEGKSVPYSDIYRQPLRDVAEDLDTGLYLFPTILGQPLSNVHTLELVGFAQVSSRREDWEAFAGWIPRLATMTSVTTLNLVRCQMGPNSLTAIVRALRGLNRVALIVTDFSHPNTCVLRDEPESSATTALLPDVRLPDHDSASDLADATAVVDPVINHVESSKKPSDGPISYPIFYPPPALQTLLIDTAPYTEYPFLEFEQLSGWFHPESHSECLHSLEMGPNVSPSSLNEMLTSLGQAPNLQHLQVSTSVDALDNSEIDISRLTNLRTLCLYGSKDIWEVEEELPSIQHFLSQIPGHMPHLEVVTIVVYIEEESHIDDLGVLDDYLAEERFSYLKEVRIELFPTSLSMTIRLRDRYMTFPKVRQRFPLLDGSGILTIAYTNLDYPGPGIGTH